MIDVSQNLQRIGFVAIVDDDDELRDALASLLRASRFAIDTFASAEAFLAFPERKQVICLVLDVRLPGMSGIELQRQLIDSGCKIPIVFISARSDASVREMALNAGASAFLNKPVRAKELLNEIHAALQ